MVMVGHFDPSWIRVVRGTVFGTCEYMAGILREAGGESADEEDMEDGCLAFRTGAGALEMTELGAGESEISADVCTCLGHDLKDVDPGGVGAGIPCTHCE